MVGTLFSFRNINWKSNCVGEVFLEVHLACFALLRLTEVIRLEQKIDTLSSEIMLYVLKILQ